MSDLKENEWRSMNKILLDLYEMEDIKEFSVKLLRMFRMLITYSKGYIILFDKEGNIDRKRSSMLGMQELGWNQYIDNYFQKDYLNYVFDFTNEAISYRDTDIMEESIRKKTDFYQNFLLPHNIIYGCGIILMKHGNLLGVINLFRDMKIGDFSNKDLTILDILKAHLVNMVFRLREEQKNYSGYIDEQQKKIFKKYELSIREIEVLQCMDKGCSNAEISQELMISISTVKKHVYNIYSKTGVNSRTQLLVLIRK